MSLQRDGIRQPTPLITIYADAPIKLHGEITVGTMLQVIDMLREYVNTIKVSQPQDEELQ